MPRLPEHVAMHPGFQDNLYDVPFSHRHELFLRTAVQVEQGGDVAAFLGVEDTAMFSDPTTLTLLRALHVRRDATITVIAPPLLLTASHDDPGNGLITLGQEGIANVWYRQEIINTGTMWAAEQNGMGPEAADIRKRVATWAERWDMIPHASAGQEGVPLLVTPDNFKTLVYEAMESGTSPEYFQSSEWLALDGGRGLVIPFVEYDASLR